MNVYIYVCDSVYAQQVCAELIWKSQGRFPETIYAEES